MDTKTERIDEIVYGITEIAAGDRNFRIPITPLRDDLDAVAFGINALVEELSAAIEERDVALSCLETANAHLRAFSYAVSHDMRSPLNSIQAFSKELARKEGAGLSERGRGDLRRIENNAQRMSLLLDGLLALSTARDAELSRRECDLSAQAQDVLRALSEYSDRDVAILVEPGMTAVADPAMTRVVLENLLGNAWKFTAGVARPTIRFSRGSWAERPASRSRMMAWASIPGTPRSSSCRSSGCTLARISPDRGLGWPQCTGSSLATVAGSRRTRALDLARAFGLLSDSAERDRSGIFDRIREHLLESGGGHCHLASRRGARWRS